MIIKNKETTAAVEFVSKNGNRIKVLKQKWFLQKIMKLL